MLQIILIAWILLCAAIDARFQRVPNLLVGIGLIGALLVLLLSSQTLTGASWNQAMMALLAGLLLGVPGYRRGQMGAGDVKLLAVLGLASDLMHLLFSVVGAGLALMVWGLAAARLWRYLPAATRTSLAHFAPENIQRLPYIPFLLVGFLGATALLV